MCACLVALFHWRGQLGYPVNSHVGELPLIRNAYLFVDFFFVLSGFVIAARYRDALESRAVGLRDFVVLRVGRLWPLQLFTLALMVALIYGLVLRRYDWISFSVPPEDVSLKSAALNALMLNGMHTTGMLTWNHPSWSISAEFFTYLVFAGLWIGLRRHAWIATALLIVAMPVALYRLKGHMDATFDWGFLRALYGFAVGATVHGALRHGRPRALLEGLRTGAATMLEVLVITATCIFVALTGPSPASIAAPLVFALTIAVFSAERGVVSRLLMTRPGDALGRWSYSIYLLQFPIQELLMFGALWVALATGNAPEILFRVPEAGTSARPMLGTTPFAGDLTNVLMLGVLILASAATFRWIESPARERARRWVRERSARNT